MSVGATTRRTRYGRARVLAAARITAPGLLALLAIALPQPATSTATATATAATSTATTAPAASAGVPTPSAGVDRVGSTERFYVVGPGADGRKEFLYQIAAQTLGDGNRFREIFELNRDRPQPDGGRMTDPLDLRAGWILVLPPDAKGTGVQHGMPPDPATWTGPPPAAAANGDGNAEQPGAGFGAYLLRLGAFGLMVLLLAVAVSVLRGRHRVQPVSPPASSGPVDLGAPVVPPDTVAAVVPADTMAAVVPADTMAAVVPADTVEPVVPVVPVVPVGGTATTADDGVPAAERSDPAELRAELGQGPDGVEVRLTGAGRERDVPAYGWLPEGGRLPGATLPVVLGERDGRRLWVDLARTPDVLTITGDPDGCRRQAVGLAEQLSAAGIEVTVVGRVLGDALPPGCRRTDTFPSWATTGAGSVPAIVISGGLRGADLREARRMAAGSDGRMVPVLVGRVLRARWSLVVGRSAGDPAVQVPALRADEAERV